MANKRLEQALEGHALEMWEIIQALCGDRPDLSYVDRQELEAQGWARARALEEKITKEVSCHEKRS